MSNILAQNCRRLDGRNTSALACALPRRTDDWMTMNLAQVDRCNLQLSLAHIDKPPANHGVVTWNQIKLPEPGYRSKLNQPVPPTMEAPVAVNL